MLELRTFGAIPFSQPETEFLDIDAAAVPPEFEIARFRQD
jgi:hypothetical protein